MPETWLAVLAAIALMAALASAVAMVIVARGVRRATDDAAAQAATSQADSLRWLGEHPGSGWQQRWDAADGNRYEWIDPLCAREGLSPWAGKDELRRGLVALLLCRAILPSYDFIRRYRPCALLTSTLSEGPRRRLPA